MMVGGRAMDDSGKKILPLAVLMDDGVCVCV